LQGIKSKVKVKGEVEASVGRDSNRHPTEKPAHNEITSWAGCRTRIKREGTAGWWLAMERGGPQGRS